MTQYKKLNLKFNKKKCYWSRIKASIEYDWWF